MSHPIRRALFAAPLVFAVAALAGATTSAFAADGTFDKTLIFSGAPVVSVSTGSGYIHISPGADNQFHVVGHVHAHAEWLSAGDPDAAVKQIVANPPIVQAGNIISIGHINNSELFNNVSIDYDISTPRSTHLTAHAGSGGVEVAGISGPVSAGSGSGPLHLALANSGDVRASTGSGSIRIEGAAGGLQARTGSGSIDIAGNVSADWNLSTGSGSITVHLPDDAHFRLNASVGSGNIHVDPSIAMQGSPNHHHVSGTVNGGGPTLQAATGSGSIRIYGNATAAQAGDNTSLHVPGAIDCIDKPTQAGCRH